MQLILKRFATLWAVSALGLWVASGILGSSHLSLGGSFTTTIWAGFFLALVNVFLKPLVIFLSLPAILLSLGLFMIVVNGFMIWLVSWLYGPVMVSSFWWAIWAGVIVGLVNLLATHVIEGARK